MVETFDPQINITDSAVQQVKTLLSDDMFNDQHIIGLRVFVQGGGCSGFQYGFAFADSQNETDIIFEKEGVNFLVDEISLQYLAGSTINYKKEIYGERFEITNPNATAQCGCGSSFAV